MRLVLRAGRRALWRHPLQLLLAVTGVAVGVAVVVAVDLANVSAREAMRLSVERVAGAATHQIVAGPEGLPESLYRRLRVGLGLRRAAPVVEGGVTVPGADDLPMTLLGLDPYAEGPFRGYLGVGEGEGDAPTEMLVDPGRVAVSAEVSARLGLSVGDHLALRTPRGRRDVVVSTVVNAPDRDLSGLIFADIATAQELLGRTGRLDRVDLILDDGQAGSVAKALPPGAELVPAAARANALTQMSAAFRLNLTALSLLALVVGLFLVFNTMSFLVVQRRPMIGTLRALGVTRRQVMLQVLGDAGLVGLVGTLVGLPLGMVLASGLTELVMRTINDLYFQTVGGLALQPLPLAKGVALGLAGTLLAALVPAREAASVAPRVALSRGELEART
ncbi:MAG: FtsX-like permease family protein, partial [Ectothiorhodospiraceae bacterium]